MYSKVDDTFYYLIKKQIMVGKKFVLQLISVVLIIIGVLRILANESTFAYLRNQDLWMTDAIMLYFFKATGSFILFHGIVFWGVSKDMVRFRSIFKPYALGLFVAGTIMLISGYLNFIPIWLYGSDALICYFLAIFCVYIKE